MTTGTMAIAMAITPLATIGRKVAFTRAKRPGPPSQNAST